MGESVDALAVFGVEHYIPRSRLQYPVDIIFRNRNGDSGVTRKAATAQIRSARGSRPRPRARASASSSGRADEFLAVSLSTAEANRPRRSQLSKLSRSLR